MSAKGSEEAFAQYAQQNSSTPCPDYVLLCAGGAASSMGLFADLSERQLQDGMNMNYYTALWGAHVRAFGEPNDIRTRFNLCFLLQSATKTMIKNHVKGKIVFVGSVAGLISYAGYSGYSPAKYAIKGERVYSEIRFHSISQLTDAHL